MAGPTGVELILGGGGAAASPPDPDESAPGSDHTDGGDEVMTNVDAVCAHPYGLFFWLGQNVICRPSSV